MSVCPLPRRRCYIVVGPTCATFHFDAGFAARLVVPAIPAELPDRDGTRLAGRGASMRLRVPVCRRLQRPFAFRADVHALRRRTAHPLQPARRPPGTSSGPRESGPQHKIILLKRGSILTPCHGSRDALPPITLRRAHSRHNRFCK